MNNDIPQSVRDLIYAQRHRLLDDVAGRAVTRVIEAGVSDKFVQGLITERVRRHRIAQAFAGPIVPPKLYRGDLVFGLDTRGRVVRVRLQYCNGHVLVVAGSGAGKTVQARWLVLQIAPRVRGVWLFDLRKREFSMLRPYLARLGVDLVVLPARALRLNPLQVPKYVNPMDWAPRVSDILVMVLRLPPRASKLIHATILELYRAFGVLDGGSSYPTLFDLRETIARDSRANPQARQAIVDSLDPVLLSIGSVLRWRVGWTTDERAKRHVVFELGGLAETDKDLILNTLVLSEFTSRVACGVSNVAMNLWICCDEAGRLVSAANQEGGVSDLISAVRGTGVGLFLACQSADVAPAVVSNTALKILGRCGSARDYDAIGAAMGLTAEQRHYLSLTLVPGLFAGQVGEGDWRHPFLFRVPSSLDALSSPDMPGVTDPAVPLLPASGAERTDAFAALPTEAAVEFADWRPGGGASPVMSHNAKPATSGLSETEFDYLRAVVEHPGQPSSAYPGLAGIGAKRAQDVRKRLVDLGFLREHRVNTSGRGRAAILLEPLEAAHRLVSQDHRNGGPK